jgi:hypothetical protein
MVRFIGFPLDARMLGTLFLHHNANPSKTIISYQKASTMRRCIIAFPS